jgi:hypothetical protein
MHAATGHPSLIVNPTCWVHTLSVIWHGEGIVETAGGCVDVNDGTGPGIHRGESALQWLLPDWLEPWIMRASESLLRDDTGDVNSSSGVHSVLAALSAYLPSPAHLQVRIGAQWSCY